MSTFKYKSVKQQCRKIQRERVKGWSKNVFTDKTRLFLRFLSERWTDTPREPVRSRWFEAVCCIFHERWVSILVGVSGEKDKLERVADVVRATHDAIVAPFYYT